MWQKAAGGREERKAVFQRKIMEMRRAGRKRTEERIISRMKFGHTGLNSALFKIGNHATVRCACLKFETEHISFEREEI